MSATVPKPSPIPPPRPAKEGADLFIVDNSDSEWKVESYLHEWAELAHSMDIATGYFEIGALLALEGQWQKLEQVRILMGDEVTSRTRNTLLDGVRKKLDESIETTKEVNDFLHGVPAIVDALRREQILARVFSKAKFHAKAYITHSKYAVVGPAALVGSSNFTLPGLNQNVELNIHLKERVGALQEWYESYWQQAQDIAPELLRVIERHTREYSPFEVYAKSLQEYFRGHELTAGEWELTKSRIYPILDEYQKEGYEALLKISRQYNGAFLCDGVGLGKTFVGMMLIERLAMFDRKRVALFVPKAARGPVWEKTLERYLPHLQDDFSNFVLYNHTDLTRGGEIGRRIDRLRTSADVIIIDEAHHFRNPGTKGEGDKAPSRYRRLYDLIGGKTTYLLTATPVNNKLIDLQHMIELFSREDTGYFRKAPLGISSLSGHFRKMEKTLARLITAQDGTLQGNLEFETNSVEAEQVLVEDELFKALVVQRSRGYVKASQEQQDGIIARFPVRDDPKVAAYSIKKTYGKLLNLLDRSFAKDSPLFSLAIYYPLAYYKGDNATIDPLVENRQKAVVGLIRTLFLKRFESSAQAFENSCKTLLLKLLAWATKHSQSPTEIRRLERWKAQHSELVGYVQQGLLPLSDTDDDEDEDIITPEMLDAVLELSPNEYKIDEILAETLLDLDQVADFLEQLRQFKPAHDDKLQALIKLLKTDPVAKKHKVLIFTEFSDTARYLKRELDCAGLSDVDEVDSGTKRDRGEIIQQFAPYYNDGSSGALADAGLPETRILIATDVLAEGLNLQDATRLINYDIHWNPVRLMQRIGRVDRRMNPDTEARILADHPDQTDVRGTVAYWNFLPPDELDELLKLYGKVSHKTLKISKTFGIEGRKLLKPTDDYDALRDFNHAYESSTTQLEQMRLDYRELLKNNPGLEDRLSAMPRRVFSGKACPEPGCRAVFFCYALPALEVGDANGDKADASWTEEAGYAKWYLYDLATETILDEPTAILKFIRCEPTTTRTRALDDGTLSEIRAKLDKHIKDSYLRKVQAPVGVKPLLKAWMELS